MHSQRKVRFFPVDAKTKHGAEMDSANIKFENSFGVKSGQYFGFAIVAAKNHSRPGNERKKIEREPVG